MMSVYISIGALRAAFRQLPVCTRTVLPYYGFRQPLRQQSNRMASRVLNTLTPTSHGVSYTLTAATRFRRKYLSLRLVDLLRRIISGPRLTLCFGVLGLTTGAGMSLALCHDGNTDNCTHLAKYTVHLYCTYEGYKSPCSIWIILACVDRVPRGASLSTILSTMALERCGKEIKRLQKKS